MKRRHFLKTFSVGAAVASALTFGALQPAYAQNTIKVGVLHSLSGTMAISETVLIVEDEPEMQRMLRFLLTHAGFATRVAGNRAEIVTALRTLPSPDAVLLDVMLPDANGFDILARIRQHPVLKAIPVIMLTAKATREDVLRGLAGGADGYITKPFDHDTLMRGVRAVLGQH